MTYPSDEDDEIVSELDDDLDFLPVSKDEARALLKECQHSYISYENPLARQLIRKLSDFIKADYDYYNNKS